MRLPDKEFESVIKNTPLVSIDFVIRNKNGECLLGLRKNAPAKDYWFNLGGRIYKNETLEDAQNRIFLEETGNPLNRNHLKFLGVYDHIYTDNLFNNREFGTHYVCLTYEVVSDDALPKTMSQHHGYQWRSETEILQASDVHENTKNCFK